MLLDISSLTDVLAVTVIVAFILFPLLYFIFDLYFSVSNRLFPYFKKFFLFIKNKFNKSI